MRRVAVLFLSLLAVPAFASARTVNIEYILDASGSMNEIMGNEMKIDIAKKTLTGLVEKLPTDAAEMDLNVGLRIYGHNTGAQEDPAVGCKDTVLEVPIEGVEVEKIKGKVAAIAARGRTPIAYSLEQAKDDFPEAKEGAENIIILVSDGKETCGGDPCTVAKKLHEAGIRMKIHVVGFDIKPEERAQLECIAEVTGGEYFPADSADGLNRALGEAQEQVLKKESTSVRIKAAGPARLKLQPAPWVAGTPYYFRVVKDVDGKEVTKVRNNLDEVMLPPGDYRIVWRQWEHESGEADLGETITLKPGESTAVALNTGIGLDPAKWVPGKPEKWYLKDTKSGRKVLSISESWGPVPAPSGTYDLWYDQWQHESDDVCLRKGIEIKPGELLTVKIDTGLHLVPAAWVPGPPRSWVLKDSKTGKRVVKVRNKLDPVPVPAGTYDLWYDQWEHESGDTCIRKNVEIKEGSCAEVDLNTGIQIVPSDPDAKKPYQWVVYDKETGRSVLTVGGTWGPLPISPGRYKLSLRQTQHGHSLMEIVSDFEVKEGQLVEIGL